MASIMAPCFVQPPPRCRNRFLVRCADDRRALFNRIAPVYDNLNDLLSLGQHRVWKRMAVSWSGAKEGDRVLDLCCGSGDLAFLMSEKVGIDGKEHRVRFWWIEGDALDLPFLDDHFDAITLGYGFRNVVDRDLAMKEMFRVLKPDSKVSVLDFNKSTQPLAVMIQGWMIDNVVVPTAGGFGLAQEYEYLKMSIEGYLTGEELEQLALGIGFSSATFYEIAGGMMGNLVATR